jgi:sugar phosphate isomerase/epimerase
MRPSLYPRALGWDLPAREQIAFARESGFPSIDLAVRDLADQGESATSLRRALDASGLLGGGFPLPVDWRRFQPSLLEAELARLPRLADDARTLGLTAASTWVLPAAGPDALALACAARPPYAPPRELDHDGLLRLHFALLTPIVRILSARGLRLALEVIGVESFRANWGTPFIHRLADPRLRWLIDALNDVVDSPPGGAVGLLCDTFHLHAAGETVDHALAFGRDAIAWVHVADLPAGFQGSRPNIEDDDRGLPGESGLVPIRDILGRLAAAGYDGPVSPEPLRGCRALHGLGPSEQAHRLRAALAAVWPRT